MLHSFHFFFHLKFSNGGGKGAGRVKGGFILGGILLYYFINVMIKTLYISGFIVVYVIYFTQSSYYYVVFFLLPEKLHFWLQEMHLLPQFLT